MSISSHYNGSRSGLLISFDVGEVWSAIAFCVLEKGRPASIWPVTRYIGSSNGGADSLVPTAIYYDKKGSCRAIGAQTQSYIVQSDAAHEGWIRISGSQFLTATDERLRCKIRAVEILGDYLKYLHKCVKQYVEETRFNGRKYWKDSITFVLSHPNDWDSDQIQHLRGAASLAGITDKDGHNIELITSGEAALHCYIGAASVNPTDLQDNAVGILQTRSLSTSLSVYTFTPSPRKIEEVCKPYHIDEGFFIPPTILMSFIKERLRGSRYGDEVEVKNIVACFANSTLSKFKCPGDSASVKFGTARDNYPAVGIRAGRLKLNGQDLMNIFEVYIQVLVEAIRNQVKASMKPLMTIFLVGEFAGNDWLFSRLQALPEFRTLRFERARYPGTGCARGGVASQINVIPSIPWSPETEQNKPSSKKSNESIASTKTALKSRNVDVKDKEEQELFKARITSLEDQIRQYNETITASQAFYEELLLKERSLSRYLADEIEHMKQAGGAVLDRSIRKKRENSSAKETIAELQERLKEEQENSESWAKQMEELRELAETRRLELGDLDQARPKDTVMAEEAVSMVKNLNDEIFQVAAAMTEEEMDGAPEALPAESKAAYERVSEQLGNGVADLLRNGKGDNLPIILQTAFQASMVRKARKIARWWTFEDDRKLEESYESVYQSIKDNKDATEAGKWRSTTKSHLRERRESDLESLEDWLSAQLTSDLVSIMQTARFSTPFSQDHLSKHSSSIENVVNSSLTLHRAIGEKIFSTDLDPFEVSWGTKFDPERMRDADQPSGKQNLSTEGYVLCMAMLGLKQVGGGASEQKEVILLEPTVLLEEFAKELKASGG